MKTSDVNTKVDKLDRKSGSASHPILYHRRNPLAIL